MKPYKTVIYSFFVGGTFALIAQALLVVWQTLLVDTPMSFFMGGATLISMGIIGCILGGFGTYQLVQKWATFGALLPFSGFAMAVGMKMIKPWTQGKSTAKSIWPGAWLVIWFNILLAAICIAIGFACTAAGIEPAMVAEKTTTALIFPYAFLMGGILCAIFQVVYLIIKAITPKCEPLWILITAWMCGCIFAPCGLSSVLMNVFGEGFAVLIPVGGLNMYNVGAAFAMGEMGEGLLHLGSFMLAVFGLFFTGLATFLIYRAKFDRKPINEVHAEMGKALTAENTKPLTEGDETVDEAATE